MTTTNATIKSITCLDGSVVTVRELPEGFVVLRRHDDAGCPDTVFAGPFKDATPATLSLALDMATDLARRVNTELRAQWNTAGGVPAPKSMQEVAPAQPPVTKKGGIVRVYLHLVSTRSGKVRAQWVSREGGTVLYVSAARALHAQAVELARLWIRRRNANVLPGENVLADTTGVANA